VRPHARKLRDERLLVVLRDRHSVAFGSE
jgi:hypothetical protein